MSDSEDLEDSEINIDTFINFLRNYKTNNLKQFPEFILVRHNVTISDDEIEQIVNDGGEIPTEGTRHLLDNDAVSEFLKMSKPELCSFLNKLNSRQIKEIEIIKNEEETVKIIKNVTYIYFKLPDSYVRCKFFTAN